MMPNMLMRSSASSAFRVCAIFFQSNRMMYYKTNQRVRDDAAVADVDDDDVFVVRGKHPQEF